MSLDRTVPSTPLAIIGGSGLYTLQEIASATELSIATPYAAEPVVISLEETPAGRVHFLPRHGKQHSIAPHLINYRANLWALHQANARAVVAINAVGGIGADMQPGLLVVPDQIIDYTWGREHTYVAGAHALERHVDFTSPYDAMLGTILQESALELGIPVHAGGVYAATQGPRLETAAEIRKLQREGCDIVGMTGMPEAALARELGLRYACLALVVNRAAGLGGGVITAADIEHHLGIGVAGIRQVLAQAMPRLLRELS